MGIGTSACKGLMGGDDGKGDPGEVPRSLSTVTRLPFLPIFEDRPPYQPTAALCEKDMSLLKALTHHRTPFAVVDCDTTRVIHASGGFVAGMGLSVEDIEGADFEALLKKASKAQGGDIRRLLGAIRKKEVRFQQTG